MGVIFMSVEAKKKVKAETRTPLEINFEINRHLEEPLSVPSCLESIIRLIPTGSDSNLLKKKRIELEKIETHEAYQIRNFCRKVSMLDSSVIILKNLETAEFRFIQPKKSSRYFDDGRNKIKKMILKKIGKNISNGVMITLTYDPKKECRSDAWEHVGKHISMFFDWMNMYRKRRLKSKKRLTYFWVIEEQKGTGFPHIHIFFPGLKFVANFYDIKKRWKEYGSVHIGSYKSINVARYITKYIGKMKGFSLLALSYLWQFRRRIYSFSKSIKENQGPGAVKEKKYELWGVFNSFKGYGEYQEKERKINWLGLIPINNVIGSNIEDDKYNQKIYKSLCEGLI